LSGKERAFIVAIIEIQPSQETSSFDISSIVADWQASMNKRVEAQQLAASTAKAYLRGTKKFFDWCDAADIKMLDYDTIIDWQGSLLKAGKAPASVNTWMAGVKALFAWAEESRGLAYNPAKRIKGASRKGTGKRHKRESLSDAEIRLLLTIPDTRTNIGKRDLAILSLMAYTGARTVEVHRADITDLRTEKGRLVLYVIGKGHSEADDIIVLINPRLQDAILAWQSARKTILAKKSSYDKKNIVPESSLFISLSDRSYGKRLSLRAIRGLVKKYYGLAEITGKFKTTHSLRHTAITNAITHGAPLQKAQAMARHSSPETTMVYFHEIDRIEEPAEQFVDYGENPTHQEPL
jgi:integrase/recombinase XerD